MDCNEPEGSCGPLPRCPSPRRRATPIAQSTSKHKRPAISDRTSITHSRAHLATGMSCLLDLGEPTRLESEAAPTSAQGIFRECVAHSARQLVRVLDSDSTMRRFAPSRLSQKIFNSRSTDHVPSERPLACAVVNGDTKGQESRSAKPLYDFDCNADAVGRIRRGLGARRGQPRGAVVYAEVPVDHAPVGKLLES